MVRQRREDEDPPRRGKRRRPARRRLVPILAAVIGTLLLGGLAGLAYWVYDRLRTDRPTVPAPVAFDTYNGEEGTFRCEYPAGWKVHREGAKDHYDWTCTRGGASIEISQGLITSLLGDIAGALGGQVNDPDRSPVARVHEVRRGPATEKFNNYQEEPAETIATKFGPARRSAFTATGTFGRKLRGYRATVLGHMTGYDVICQCPEADWENLRPAFGRVLESLGPGTGS